MDPIAGHMKARKKPRSLYRDVADELSAQIRAGAFAPGDKLPTESEIMKASGVSRTVVREAVTHLQAAGLVETRHGIGTFVLPPTNKTGFRIDPATLVTIREILALMELRVSLETEAAGLAAMRRTDEQLAEMQQSLDAFQSNLKHPGDDTVSPDFQFHLHIARATGNLFFSDIMNHLGTVIIPRTRVNSAQLAGDDLVRYLARLASEHEAIYEAIRSRDAEAARSAMRLHLSNSRERLRRANENADPNRQ
jgi:GntR family transcriptional regulator, transcriptional repressor for pyruvate dehydrogenase complex